MASASASPWATHSELLEPQAAAFVARKAVSMTSLTFAAAQQRVAARHAQREAATTARASTQRAHLTSTRIPTALIGPAASLQSYWHTITSTSGTRPAFRVGQVDAELLDEELLSLFKGQVGEVLKYYGAHLSDDWSAEILLVLRALLFKLTIWDHDASYGASLQNLRYVDARTNARGDARPARWQKALYGLVSVGGRYAWTRWEEKLLDVEGGYEEPSQLQRQLARFSSFASTTHSFAAFASFLVFLVNGKYRTMLDRILRLRLLPASSQVNREVSFEYLNRQLVWHAFTEFLLFILPLVGISRWRRLLARAWRKTKSFIQGSGNEDGDETPPAGELAFLPERTCAICYQDQNPTGAAENEMAAITGNSGGVVGSTQTDVTNPYETIPCGCVYCFVCLAQRLDVEDGDGWTCLRCGELVKECKPWNGDVLEDVEQANGEQIHQSANDASKESKHRPNHSLVHVEPVPEEDERSTAIANEIEKDLAEQREGDEEPG